MWLGCSFVSSWVSNQQEESKSMLEGQLRRRFLPLLVDENLKVLDVPQSDIDADLSTGPSPWNFGGAGPCMGYSVIGLAHCAESPPSDALVFTTLACIVVVVALLAPSNGVGGAGYTFWTENVHYHRLLALYNIVFDDKYREAIIKDDLGAYLSAGGHRHIHTILVLTRFNTEYRTTSEALGSVKSNLLTLACSLPPPWYWSQVQTLIADYPMILLQGLYMFFNIRSLTTASLVSVAVFQYGINSLTKAVDALRNGQYSDSITGTMRNARRFMKSIGGDAARSEDASAAVGVQVRPLIYPNLGTSKGMHLYLKDVTLRYPEQDHDALKNVTVTIKSGELILLVGANGSGKSSLLKVITSTVPPNSIVKGRVKVNRNALRRYSPSSIRRSIAYVSQSEQIYPLSILENILIGIGEDSKGIPSEQLSPLIEAVAREAQCDDLLQRYGEHTVLQRCRVVGQSLRGCGNGDVGRGASKELRRYDPSYRHVVVTPGEKQRLVLARCLLRIKRRHCDLVILDEATSALDPITETRVFESLDKYRNGKTMILVTHRIGMFPVLTDFALLLVAFCPPVACSWPTFPPYHSTGFAPPSCMDGGRIVQNGTHDELMKDALHSHYRDLFTAQTVGFNDAHSAAS
ncbi:hypothetical protein NMY22_g15410 [Coprinellus aureogranulatus]|nr:hypothetical protein NMY22_g15410 [Coprinellus aureogranulatus]